jgi:hypothetical protein
MLFQNKSFKRMLYGDTINGNELPKVGTFQNVYPIRCKCHMQCMVLSKYFSVCLHLRYSNIKILSFDIAFHFIYLICNILFHILPIENCNVFKISYFNLKTKKQLSTPILLIWSGDNMRIDNFLETNASEWSLCFQISLQKFKLILLCM